MQAIDQHYSYSVILNALQRHSGIKTGCCARL